MALVTAAASRGAEVPASIARIAAELKQAGAAFGSHDDGTPEARAGYDALGRACLRVSDHARGGGRGEGARQSGADGRAQRGARRLAVGQRRGRGADRRGALRRARLGLLLPALAAAAWALADRGALDFADAWRLISTGRRGARARRPGRDREGARADVVVMDPRRSRRPSSRAAGAPSAPARPAHLAGAAAGSAVLSGGSAGGGGGAPGRAGRARVVRGRPQASG